MGSMVCLCGKSYRDPINMYTKEKDPFWACLEKCQTLDRWSDEWPTYEEVREHNDCWEYKKGGMVWGK